MTFNQRLCIGLLCCALGWDGTAFAASDPTPAQRREEVLAEIKAFKSARTFDIRDFFFGGKVELWMLTELENELYRDESVSEAGSDYKCSTKSVWVALFAENALRNTSNLPESVYTWIYDPGYRIPLTKTDVLRDDIRVWVRENREALRATNYAALKPPSSWTPNTISTNPPPRSVPGPPTPPPPPTPPEPSLVLAVLKERWWAVPPLLLALGWLIWHLRRRA